MKSLKTFILSILMLTSVGCYTAIAQNNENKTIINSKAIGLEYEIRAAISIGGTSPLPLPEEIRKIEKYSPTFCYALEGDVIKWFGTSRKWGMLAGVRAERKGMETKASVKNYSMSITGDDGEHLKGNWTGKVQTEYSGTFISIPVMATLQINPRLRLHAGPYLSCMLDGDFSGIVYDGYLRENDPTGNKVQFEGEKTANYDFSEDLRNFQYGMQIGVNWKAFKHLTLSGDLAWGLNNIFKKDFETVTFNMYPIYFSIGFGYAF